MAYKFPSDEWVKALKKILNESESYQRSAKDWEGDFIFIVEADENYSDTSYLLVELLHGKCLGAGMADPDNLPETDYTVSAPFTNWKKVIDAKLDPIQGMMTGQLKLKGNLMKVIRYPKAAQEIVSCCSLIPTEW